MALQMIELVKTNKSVVGQGVKATKLAIKVNGLIYNEKADGTYELVGPSDYAGTTLNIPASVCGKAVTSIGEYAFAYNKNIATVLMPNSILYIGDYAFTNGNNTYSDHSNCGRLRTVQLSDNLVKIGYNAFYPSALCVEQFVGFNRGSVTWNSGGAYSHEWYHTANPNYTGGAVTPPIGDGSRAPDVRAGAFAWKYSSGVFGNCIGNRYAYRRD